MPSVLSGDLMFRMSSIVGSTSVVSTFSRLTLPFSWPGALMNSGTGASSSTLVSLALRRSNWSFLNDTPWSAVTTTIALSHTPSFFRCAISRWTSLSTKPTWSRWRCWSTSTWPWSL